MEQFVSVALVFLCFHNVLCGPGDIAKAKCQEYAKYVNSVEDSPILLRSASKNTVSQCGIVEVPLIVGGVKTSPKEFPHMAVIGYGKSPNDNLQWICGGSLISELFVLSAAHCISSDQLGPAQKVRLGEVDFVAIDETDIQERVIVEKIEHPDRKLPARYHDVVLFKMDSPVKFNAFIRPACLNVEPNINSAKVLATGFGKLSFDSDGGSKQLMKVQLSIIDSQTCGPFYEKDKRALSNGITDSLICAGEMAGGKDSCQGDSGGPLQSVLSDPYCMYNLIGVVSFGKFCGFKNSPGIYSRVSYYVPWIESIVWK